MSVALLLLRKIIFKKAWVRIEGKRLGWKIPALEPWKKTQAQHHIRTPTLEDSDCPALHTCSLTEPLHLGRTFPAIQDFLPQSVLAGEQEASIQHLAFTYEKSISAPVSRESKKKKKFKKIKISRVHLLSRLPVGPQAHAEAGKNCSASQSFFLQTHQPEALKWETPNMAWAQLPLHSLSAAKVIKGCTSVSNCKGFAWNCSEKETSEWWVFCSLGGLKKKPQTSNKKLSN